MNQKIFTLFGLIFFMMINFNCAKKSEAPENLFSTNSETDSDPIVCTLSDADLIQRKEFLKENIFSKVIKTTEVNNGYIFYFKNEKGLLSQLAKLISEEQKCCTFFHYDISIQSKSRGIALKISGPLGAKMMIASNFEF